MSKMFFLLFICLSEACLKLENMHGRALFFAKIRECLSFCMFVFSLVLLSRLGTLVLATFKIHSLECSRMEHMTFFRAHGRTRVHFRRTSV